MSGYTDRCLLHRRVSGEDAKGFWESVRERIAPDYYVEPVLIDDQGAQSYPTGRVSIRFRQNPSESELSELSEQWGLTVSGRNRYVPTQVTFDTRPDARQFLPDLVRRLGERENVYAVWPETLAQYTRGNPR